ncbi:MAG: nucleoside recognition domain-containing protein [Bacillota bacterium]
MQDVDYQYWLQLFNQHSPEYSSPMLESLSTPRAIRELLNAWEKEKRPPGKIIGDATRNSINNLISIGGFIILFSVIIQSLTATGFISGISQILGIIFLPLGFSPEVLPSISSGIFELTIGTKMISETTTPIMQQVIIAAIILGWSGLSAQTQVASMISNTDIRILPYIISRIGQALIAALYTVLFFKTVGPASSYIAVPAMATLDKLQEIPPLVIGLQSSGIFILSIISLTFFAVVYNAILKLKSRF